MIPTKSMYRTTGNKTNTDPIHMKMARARIGCTVSLLSSANTIARGVVTDVFQDAGAAKLVVGGLAYDLRQLLTATPASLCSQ